MLIVCFSLPIDIYSVPKNECKENWGKLTKIMIFESCSYCQNSNKMLYFMFLLLRNTKGNIFDFLLECIQMNFSNFSCMFLNPNIFFQL